MPGASEGRNDRGPEQNSRIVLTFIVVGLAMFGVVSLSIAVLVFADDQNQSRLENAKFVFSAVLPLLAGWVGMILTYYFSKENFLAAQQSVTQMARSVTSLERLRTLSVEQTMRPAANIRTLAVRAGEEGQVKLADLLVHFADVDRVVIVDDAGQPKISFLIYKALIHEYISELARGARSWPAGKTAVAELTLGDLVQSSGRRELFSRSFGFVSAAATLAEVKAVMDAIPGCNDVFVTRSGKPTEPIVGWITDNKIAEHSRVG